MNIIVTNNRSTDGRCRPSSLLAIAMACGLLTSSVACHVEMTGEARSDVDMTDAGTTPSAAKSVPLTASELPSLGLSFHAPSPDERLALPESLRASPSQISNPTWVENMNSGKLLEIYHSSTANARALADQYQYNNSATQKWTVVTTLDSGGPVYFTFINLNSHKCLTSYGNENFNGTVMTQWTCEGADNQHFHILRNPDNTLSITRFGDLSKVIEVYHSSLANSAIVDEWDDNGTMTQHWELVPVS
jgi:hypothetical protein